MHDSGRWKCCGRDRQWVQTIVALETMDVSHAEKNNHPVETALSV
jgi:hypothetical protein